MGWGWGGSYTESYECMRHKVCHQQHNSGLVSTWILTSCQPHCSIVVEVSLYRRFEGMGALNVTAVRRRRIPLLWSRVREGTLSKGFNFNMGDAKCPCVCRRTKLSGRCVHSEKVREVGRG